MRFEPFLSPDDAEGGEEKRFSESEMQQLLSQRLNEEKQRYEAALRERESELREHQMRQKAQEALKSRNLPDPLLNMLNLSSNETLAQTLSAAETAFRAALEEGVRSRLRGQAPGQIPLPQKARKTRNLSYQEAAANYMRDRHNT